MKDKYSKKSSVKAIKTKANKVEKLPFYKNILYYVAFFLVLSLILFWFTRDFILILVVVVLGFSIYALNKRMCKNCRRLFHKVLIKKEHYDTIIEPWHYRIQYLYFAANGPLIKKEFGERLTRNERIEVYRSYFKCRWCGYEWHEDTNVNIDKANRPKTTEHIHTDIKICLRCRKVELRSRRKYCSKCRPYGRSRPYDDYGDSNYDTGTIPSYLRGTRSKPSTARITRGVGNMILGRRVMQGRIGGN